MIGSSVRILRHMHSSASFPIITILPQLVLAASHTIRIARANHAVRSLHSQIRIGYGSLHDLRACGFDNFKRIETDIGGQPRPNHPLPSGVFFYPAQVEEEPVCQSGKALSKE